MLWLGQAAVLFPLTANAENLTFSRNARTFETQNSSITVKGLAFACLSLMNVPDGLPCNPALVPFIEKAGMSAKVQLSNGYSSLDKVRKLLDADKNPQNIDFFFTDGKVLQIDTQIDVFFKSKYLTGQFIPTSLKGFSVLRNEANPDVDLFAVDESGFQFQTGHQLTNSFSIGAQARLMQRKYIRKQFKLLDLTTEAGAKILTPQTQNVLFLEPGLLWRFGKQIKSDMDPRLSAMLVNLGTLSAKSDDMPQPVETQIGFGLTPVRASSLGDYGQWDLMLDYKSLSYQETASAKLRLGSLYSFGSMRLFAGIDASGISGGVFTSLQAIQAAITYSTTKFVNEREGFFTQTVYMQIGWEN